MGDLSRIGVAIDSELLRDFDRFIEKKGYQSLSSLIDTREVARNTQTYYRKAHWGPQSRVYG